MSSIVSQIKLAEKRFDKSTDSREMILNEISKIDQGKTLNWKLLDQPARYHTRLKLLGLEKEADAFAKGENIDFNPLERILDASELSEISFFEKGITAARTVARVLIRDSSGRVLGFGTGAMISPKLFMTNNHVLSTANAAENSLIQFEYLDSFFGPKEPFNFRLLPSEFFVTNEGLDFSIVAVEEFNSDGNELKKQGWNKLIGNSGKAVVGERVNIIQHPGGKRLQMVVRDNTIIGAVDNFLHYRADTEPGSSGSPVYSDQWEMAALHHAGKPKRDANNRILMIDGNPWTGLKTDVTKIAWEANEGVRISKILQYMNTVSLDQAAKTLWNTINIEPEPKDIWSLFHGSDFIENKNQIPSNNLVESQDENGNPSWLFRLSFGPVSQQGTIGNSIMPLDLKNKPSNDHIPTSIVVTDNSANTSSMAEQIYERFRHNGSYYDKAEDTELSNQYWSGIDLNTNANELFDQLKNYLKSTHAKVFSYKRARHEFLYPSIDLHPDNSLHNVYSGKPFSPVEAIADELDAFLPYAETFGLEVTQENVDGILENENIWESLENSTALSFNCEHVVCQSWFQKRQPMKADLHHLFACNPGCNSFRSNIPYWEFDPTEEAVRSECGRREEESKFEPEFNKGVVARATMYFLMRYPGELDNRKSKFNKKRIKTLIDWHNSHPVNEYEKHRNWLIHKAQGNRNIFIDFPDKASLTLLHLGVG